MKEYTSDGSIFSGKKEGEDLKYVQKIKKGTGFSSYIYIYTHTHTHTHIYTPY